MVLLHGITCSERVWRRVVPLLADAYDVIALTALGHRGGPQAGGAVTTISDVVADIERQLDELGLDRPHLAGNSLGGWVALELARRGRGRTVCALSPAGCWEANAADQGHADARLRRVVRLTELTRAALPLAARLRVVRRLAMRDNAVHGDRLSRGEFIDMADDLLGCDARDDLLGTSEQLAPMDPLPCPVVLAWSGSDRIFPPEVNGVRARALFPQADWRVLPGIGHLSMIDDPALVARTIRETAQLNPLIPAGTS